MLNWLATGAALMLGAALMFGTTGEIAVALVPAMWSVIIVLLQPSVTDHHEGSDGHE